MDFSNIFKKQKPVLSFEFFPPKKEQSLSETETLIRDLSTLSPDFLTVTYGALGGTRGHTTHLVHFIAKELQIPAVAHLTCVGHTKEEIRAILKQLEELGVSKILALRGDPPRGSSEFQAPAQGLSCARDLVAFIKSEEDKLSSRFSVAVAGYPETHRDALDPQSDIDYLKQKVEAGAELIITQLFFETELYFRFVDKARSAGINLPILPGIMPVSNVNQIKRFTSMCGASIPRKMLETLEQLEHDPLAVQAYGIDYALKQGQELLQGGAPGVHFYTLNKSAQIKAIVQSLF